MSAVTAGQDRIAGLPPPEKLWQDCKKCVKIMDSGYNQQGVLTSQLLCGWCPDATADAGRSCMLKGSAAYLSANGGQLGTKCHWLVDHCAAPVTDSAQGLVVTIAVLIALCCCGMCCYVGYWVYQEPPLHVTSCLNRSHLPDLRGNLSSTLRTQDIALARERIARLYQAPPQPPDPTRTPPLLSPPLRSTLSS